MNDKDNYVLALKCKIPINNTYYASSIEKIIPLIAEDLMKDDNIDDFVSISDICEMLNCVSVCYKEVVSRNSWKIGDLEKRAPVMQQYLSHITNAKT